MDFLVTQCNNSKLTKVDIQFSRYCIFSIKWNVWKEVRISYSFLSIIPIFSKMCRSVPHLGKNWRIFQIFIWQPWVPMTAKRSILANCCVEVKLLWNTLSHYRKNWHQDSCFESEKYVYFLIIILSSNLRLRAVKRQYVLRKKNL